MSKRKLFLPAIASLAVPLLSRADIVFDLREATTANKTINVSLGQVVHMELYVRVSGTDADATNEGLQTAAGNIKTTGSSIKANAGVHAVVAPFTASGSSAGTLSDLDGDGDLDIGSNSSGSASGWITARAASMQSGQTFKLLTFDLTITAVGPGNTVVEWTRRSGNAFMLWREDGAGKNAGSAISKLKLSPATLVFSAVPLPPAAPLALGLLAALGLASKTRRSRP